MPGGKSSEITTSKNWSPLVPRIAGLLIQSVPVLPTLAHHAGLPAAWYCLFDILFDDWILVLIVIGGIAISMPASNVHKLYTFEQILHINVQS